MIATNPSLASSRLRAVTLGLCVALSFASVLPALDSEESTFVSDGAKIRYIEAGQGEPVVLIHGFTASAEANWVLPGIYNKLGEDFRVIAIDNRGHGKSDKPHDAGEYGDKMVNDVVALLDHLELEKAHVVGYSMGGLITMRLLALAPERVLSATVGGAGWRPPGVEDPLMETLAKSLESGQGAGPLIEALNPVGAEPPTQEQIAMANQMILAQNDPKALAAVIRGMANLGVERDTLEKNSVPTLALIGSLDPLKEGVDAMDGVMKELTVQVIDGADHMTALMSPQYSQAMADAIRDFVMKSCNCG
ncbi:MAG: alpha/beta hydrolase [Acidobacteriota bacterium]